MFGNAVDQGFGSHCTLCVHLCPTPVQRQSYAEVELEERLSLSVYLDDRSYLVKKDMTSVHHLVRMVCIRGQASQVLSLAVKLRRIVARLQLLELVRR